MGNRSSFDNVDVSIEQTMQHYPEYITQKSVLEPTKTNEEIQFPGHITDEKKQMENRGLKYVQGLQTDNMDEAAMSAYVTFEDNLVMPTKKRHDSFEEQWNSNRSKFHNKSMQHTKTSKTTPEKYKPNTVTIYRNKRHRTYSFTKQPITNQLPLLNSSLFIKNTATVESKSDAKEIGDEKQEQTNIKNEITNHIDFTIFSEEKKRMQCTKYY
eukprot:361679_1